MEEIEKSFREEKAKRLNAIEELRANLGRCRDELLMLKPNSPMFIACLGRCNVLESQIEAEQNSTDAYLQYMLKRIMENIYLEIAQCCEQIRPELGLDVIFKVEPGVFKDVYAYPEWNMRVHARGIIAWDSGLDVTGKVIEKLNQQR